MKHLLILGAGTAGTMLANKLHARLDPSAWQLTVVDRSPTHYYQPGFLFIPFGLYQPEHVQRDRRELLPWDVQFVLGEAAAIEPGANRLRLASGQTLPYDFLIIATGAALHPEATEALTGELWRTAIFDFYTLEGAVALGQALKAWPGGRLVLNIAGLPIKGPMAPLEFLFLADDFFTRHGRRDKVELRLVTPQASACDEPGWGEAMDELLARKGITVTANFNAYRVDTASRHLMGTDGRAVPFDLLVTVPVHRGAAAVASSGLGDARGFVPVDKHTLRSSEHANIFALGDAANVPALKAGVTAHFESEVVLENVQCALAGAPLAAKFDGHTNCFIEVGHGKGLVLDYDYDHDPTPGPFPLPALGPFTQLKETRLNHLGKLAYRYVYWNRLLPGQGLPLVAKRQTGKLK